MIADGASGVNWIWALLCFGALMVPLSYVVVSRFRGRATRAMIIGGGIQLTFTLLVFSASDFDYRLGNTEGYLWIFAFPFLNLLLARSQ
jgi:hypothetical protein